MTFGMRRSTSDSTSVMSRSVERPLSANERQNAGRDMAAKIKKVSLQIMSETIRSVLQRGWREDVMREMVSKHAIARRNG